MTDEEMAEKYAGDYGSGSHIDLGDCQINLFPVRKWSFFDGLKAGRPKWHKIADGGYPPCETCEKGNYTISVLTDKGDIAYYSYNYDCWIAEPSSVEIDPPIAWCEIPKFEENI